MAEGEIDFSTPKTKTKRRSTSRRVIPEELPDSSDSDPESEDKENYFVDILSARRRANKVKASHSPEKVSFAGSSSTKKVHTIFLGSAKDSDMAAKRIVSPRL